jgi:hypothetical protein
MRVQEGPLIGGLRVVSVGVSQADGSDGFVELSPDNDMTGTVYWTVDAETLARINIGDRIIMEAPAKWYPPE